MNHFQTGKAPAAVAAEKANPDVIVTRADQTTLFKAQNRRVSEWLRRNYNLTTGRVKGDTEIQVHPTRCKRIIEELKAAGFEVARETAED
jgi:hypothetical protein